MLWSDRFSTGVPRLDAQHQLLFRMVDDFRLAVEEGRGERVYGEFLASLELYSRMHFSAEEECMFRFRCPAAAANRVGHEAFRVMVAELRRSQAESGFRLQDADHATRELDHWLIEHIGRIDTQLLPLVAKG